MTRSFESALDTLKNAWPGVFFACLAALLPGAALATHIEPEVNCLPSCEADDGRFLAITDGQLLETLNDQELDIEVRSPLVPDFELLIFDGETSGFNERCPPIEDPEAPRPWSRNCRWDVNVDVFSPVNPPPPADVNQWFRLYPDGSPFDGKPDAGSVPLLEINADDPLDGTRDGDWEAFVVDNAAVACERDEGVPPPATPGDCTTGFSYVLRATLEGPVPDPGEPQLPPSPVVRSVFKVQTSTEVAIQVTQQPFSFIAAMPTKTELNVVFPGNTCGFSPDPIGPYPDCLGVPVVGNVPDYSQSNYDGTFSFFLEVRGAQGQAPQLEIWGGDQDRERDWDAAAGAYDLSSLQDTNDCNTPRPYPPGELPEACTKPDGTPGVDVVGDLPPWGYLCTEPGKRLGDPGCTVVCSPPTAGSLGDFCIKQVANFEGVAVTTGPGGFTGDPRDDQAPIPGSNNEAALYRFWRPPAVRYEVFLRERFDGESGGVSDTTPIATNDNPTGNREWEVFCLLCSSPGCPDPEPPQVPGMCNILQFDPSDPGADPPLTIPVEPDAEVDELPPGIYEIRVSGLDMENLNAFRFDADVVSEPDLAVGDFVWLDLDGDGVQDPGEPGIPGVEVKLWSDPQQTTELGTTTTDADGGYLFEGLVPANNCGDASGCSYLVEVTGANFGPGGPLEGLVTTLLPPDPIPLGDGEGLVRLAPDVELDPVGEEDVRTFDFPYRGVQGSCEISRPVRVIFLYTGDSCSSPAASQNDQGGRPGTRGDYRCSGDLDNDEPVSLVVTKKTERFTVSPAPDPDAVVVGGLIRVASSEPGKAIFPATRVAIVQEGAVLQEIDIHTSCSQPFEVGDQFGSLLVVGFENL